VNQHDSERISQMSTMWTALRAAHAGDPAAISAARELLFERYGPPVKRYLARLTGDPEARDELWQEFAARLIQGDFRNIDPAKGRFRSYLKTVLVRMAHRHRKLADRRATVDLDQAPAELTDDDDQVFDSQWREHLIERTWNALRDARPVYEQVLRLRAELPDASSQELAVAMHERHGIEWTAETLRQTLRRARQRFGELLLDEIAHSVEPVSRETVEEELAALELLSYCKPWFEKWMASA